MTYRRVNALAEIFIGLYKAECVFDDGPWNGMGAVKWATLAYADWFNHHRLPEEICMVPRLAGFLGSPHSPPLEGTHTSTHPRTGSAAELAAAYYEWSFASDPAFSQWPFYPNADDELNRPGNGDCSFL